MSQGMTPDAKMIRNRLIESLAALIEQNNGFAPADMMRGVSAFVTETAESLVKTKSVPKEYPEVLRINLDMNFDLQDNWKTMGAHGGNLIVGLASRRLSKTLDSN